jgi:hypothetical protein
VPCSRSERFSHGPWSTSLQPLRTKRSWMIVSHLLIRPRRTAWVLPEQPHTAPLFSRHHTLSAMGRWCILRGLKGKIHRVDPKFTGLTQQFD